MTNPFQSTYAAQGLATDSLQVTANDNPYLSAVAISIYRDLGRQQSYRFGRRHLLIANRCLLGECIGHHGNWYPHSCTGIEVPLIVN